MGEAIVDIETTGIRSFSDKIILVGILTEDNEIYQVGIDKYAEEKDMLQIAISKLIDLDVDRLIGWKINKFDIPFLKARLLKYRLYNCIKYIDTLEVLDLADALKSYMVEGREEHFREVFEGLGCIHTDRVEGSDIPSLYKVSSFADIYTHNSLDLLYTKELYEIIKPALH